MPNVSAQQFLNGGTAKLVAPPKTVSTSTFSGGGSVTQAGQNITQPTPKPPVNDIAAGEKQGVNPLHKDPNFGARNFIEGALPAAGATLGAIGGGIVGSVVPGAGTYAGSVAGSTVGGSIGEAAKQGIENLTGQQKGFSMTNVANQGLGMGAMEAIAAPVLKYAGKFFEAGGEQAVKTAIPKSSEEAGLLQTYRAGKNFWSRFLDAIKGESTAPRTSGKTVFEKGLMGTESMLGVRAKQVANNLWDNLISPQLKSSTKVIDIPAFFKDAEDEIIKSVPEKSMQKALLEALESFKEDYKGVKTVTLEELQKFKEGWAKNIPEKIYRGKPIAGAANNVKDVLASQARNIIYKELGPEVKQAYLDYGNLKGVMDLGKKAMTGGGLKGGFGSFWNTIKDEALTPVLTLGGQAIYKTGQGIEFIGSSGARVLRDLFLPSSDQNTNQSPQQ